MFRLILPKKVQKEIEQIDQKMHLRIFAALAAIAADPYAGKKLLGKYQDLRSYRVWPYRIIYTIKKRELLVLVIKVGHRQEVY